MVETSWAKPGGMDDRAELVGPNGITYVDILRGSALLTYSEHGYGYAVEKAPQTSGWTFTMFDELWNYGFPQEMRHFVDCVLNGGEPAESGRGRPGRARDHLRDVYGRRGAGRLRLPLDLPAEVAARPPYLRWKGGDRDGC